MAAVCNTREKTTNDPAMVTDRISIITEAYLSDSSNYKLLTLVNDFPTSANLVTYFQEVPLVLEGGELSEGLEDTQQGDLQSIQLRLKIGRDSEFYKDLIHRKLIAAVKMANGEQILLGSGEYPLSYGYDRNSGASATAERDTTMTFQVVIPV